MKKVIFLLALVAQGCFASCVSSALSNDTNVITVGYSTKFIIPFAYMFKSGSETLKKGIMVNHESINAENAFKVNEMSIYLGEKVAQAIFSEPVKGFELVCGNETTLCGSSENITCIYPRDRRIAQVDGMGRKKGYINQNGDQITVTLEGYLNSSENECFVIEAKKKACD